jgi:hypothetical protein
VKEEQKMQAKALQIAEQQRVKQEHDAKVGFVLRQLEDGNVAFIKGFFWKAWCDEIETRKMLARHGGGFSAEVERIKAMHSEKMMKLLFQFFSSDDGVCMKTCWHAWHNYAKACAHDMDKRRHAAQQEEGHHAHVEKTLETRCLEGSSIFRGRGHDCATRWWVNFWFFCLRQRSDEVDEFALYNAKRNMYFYDWSQYHRLGMHPVRVPFR